MKNLKKAFHLLSYLQYPLILIALFFVFLSSYTDDFFVNINSALIFYGVGISFSTLQDTTKTQNKFSKRIWENRRKGKVALIFMTIFILFVFTFGFIGYFSTSSSPLKELSLGIIVFGIGFVGLLKIAIEIYENHRKH